MIDKSFAIYHVMQRTYRLIEVTARNNGAETGKATGHHHLGVRAPGAPIMLCPDSDELFTTDCTDLSKKASRYLDPKWVGVCNIFHGPH